MISGSDIEATVRLFESRSASLYHSCQLMDFESYLQVGAIASEKLLSARGLPATDRPEDAANKLQDENDIVFSLSDHGTAFSKKLYAAPNPDGPIMFQLDPGVLKGAREIHVYLRPASAECRNEQQSMPLSGEDVEYLFRYTDQAPYPERLHIRNAVQIQEAFGTKGPMIPEIRCRMADETISLERVSATMVDNYLVFKRQLRDWVYDVQLYRGASLPLKRRYCPVDIGGHLTDALAAALLSGPPDLDELARAENEILKQWAQQMKTRGLQDDFRRYATAFRTGTLLYIEKNKNRLLSGPARQSARPVDQQLPVPEKSRELVEKMLAEKIPVESIARITDIPREALEEYLKQK